MGPRERKLMTPLLSKHTFPLSAPGELKPTLRDSEVKGLVSLLTSAERELSSKVFGPESTVRDRLMDRTYNEKSIG